jgi:hypothetical protein
MSTDQALFSPDEVRGEFSHGAPDKASKKEV